MTSIDPSAGLLAVRRATAARAASDAPGAFPAPTGPAVKPSHHLRPADTVQLSAKVARAFSPDLASATSAARAKQAAQEAPATYSRADVTSLLSNWGAAKPGSPHDLDGDGSVGAGDLAQLISRLGSPKPQPVAAQPEPYTRDDVERLLDAWRGEGAAAETRERYDLDGDGAIGAADLAALITRLGQSNG